MKDTEGRAFTTTKPKASSPDDIRLAAFQLPGHTLQLLGGHGALRVGERLSGVTRRRPVVRGDRVLPHCVAGVRDGDRNLGMDRRGGGELGGSLQ